MKYTTLFALVAVIALANCADMAASDKKKCTDLTNIPGLSALCITIATAGGVASSQSDMALLYAAADAAASD